MTAYVCHICGITSLSHLFQAHVLRVGFPACRHEYNLQSFNCFLLVVSLDVQCEGAIVLLLDPGRRALRVDVQAMDFILLCNELPAFLIKSSQGQRLQQTQG